MRLESKAPIGLCRLGLSGPSGLGQDDSKALGGVLELCLIPDIKSPSRLEIYKRSRLDDVTAQAFTLPDPIKGNPACAEITSVAEASGTLTALSV